jgi:hypothetical protein
MGLAHRALVAGGLGFGLSVLVACGRGGSLLSAGQANSLNSGLNAVSTEVANRQCAAAQGAVTSLHTTLTGFSSIDQTLVSNLDQGIREVGRWVRLDCRPLTAVTPPATTTNAQNTTPAATTTTSTTSANTTTTTTPASTSTTTTGNGGVGVGNGNDNGNAVGQGNGDGNAVGNGNGNGDGNGNGNAFGHGDGNGNAFGHGHGDPSGNAVGGVPTGSGGAGTGG